jgi:hypothetical protein
MRFNRITNPDIQGIGILGQAKRHPMGAERQIPMNCELRQIPMNCELHKSR